MHLLLYKFFEISMAQPKVTIHYVVELTALNV